MDIINKTKYDNQINKAYLRFFFYGFFLKVYIIAIIISVGFFGYIFFKIPEELKYEKNLFLFMVFPTLILAIVIVPFLLTRGIKKNIFNNEPDYEYKFFDKSFEFRFIENGKDQLCKLDYSYLQMIIETKDLFIINTNYKYTVLIIDKKRFLAGTAHSLSELLKTKTKKYKLKLKV